MPKVDRKIARSHDRKIDRRVERDRKVSRGIDRRVSRRPRGSFHSSPSISWDLPARRVAIYGDYVIFDYRTHRQRFRKTRKDGISQRYWKKVTRKVRTRRRESGRFEFHGTGKDLRRAVALAHRVMPNGFVEVDAEEFLRDPYRYGVDGEWIHREVES